MREKSPLALKWFHDTIPSGPPGWKRYRRGFTIIELLAVLAIVATLAGIAAPMYSNALDRARVTRAIVDIRTLSNEISTFQLYTGRLPSSLADIDRANFRDPYGNPYEYLNFSAAERPGQGGQDQGGGAAGLRPLMGQVRRDRFLVPINSDYDLYSRGKDGQTVPPLTAQPSWDDIVRANDGGFIGLGSEF
jgi:general secretion pathway protein G